MRAEGAYLRPHASLVPGTYSRAASSTRMENDFSVHKAQYGAYDWHQQGNDVISGGGVTWSDRINRVPWSAIIGVWVIGTLLLMYAERRDHMVASKIDHESYIVREEFENKQQAADILAEINGMYVRVINHLKKTQMHGPYAANIAFLQKNYDPSVLGEHIPWSLKYTSYVAEKGKKIRLCLRKPENRRVFHDMNTLRFVALHELTHMMIRDYGHEADFWSAFRWLLLQASSIGEIRLVDYEKKFQPYCGIMIESDPAIS